MYESYYRSAPWYTELWKWWMHLFRSDGFDIALGIALGFIALVIILSILYGIFRAMDRWFTPNEEGPGRITKRWIREGYWQATTQVEWKYHYCFSSGKYEWGPVSVEGPPKWIPPQPMVEVALIGDTTTEEFEVTQADYDAAGTQRPVRIIFQRGRISGGVYIRSYTSA